jgi:hypothetical protein
MHTLPYIVRRRQKLYLRVRVPAELVSVTGQQYFVRSLGTADPRQARATAAHLLSGLHAAWADARDGKVEKMVIFFPRIKDMTSYKGPGETTEEEEVEEQRLHDKDDRELEEMLRHARPDLSELQLKERTADRRLGRELKYHRAATYSALKLAATLAEQARALNASLGSISTKCPSGKLLSRINGLRKWA